MEMYLPPMAATMPHIGHLLHHQELAKSVEITTFISMVFQITLSAKEIKLGTAELKNDWPKAKS